MAEYNDRDSILSDITAAVDHSGMGAVIGQTLMRFVKRQPAADVAPVVHGWWTETDEDQFLPQLRGQDGWRC